MFFIDLRHYLLFMRNMARLLTRQCSRCGGSGREFDPAAVGQQMRELRMKAGLTLATVAARMVLSAPYISDLERGNRNFNEELVTRYKEALK